MAQSGAQGEALRTARVVHRLPHLFGRNEKLPEGLSGATIVQIGTFDDCELAEGGGLVIDFQEANSQVVKRLVLAFTDTAMWVEAVIQ